MNRRQLVSGSSPEWVTRSLTRETCEQSCDDPFVPCYSVGKVLMPELRWALICRVFGVVQEGVLAVPGLAPLHVGPNEIIIMGETDTLLANRFPYEPGTFYVASNWRVRSDKEIGHQIDIYRQVDGLQLTSGRAMPLFDQQGIAEEARHALGLEDWRAVFVADQFSDVEFPTAGLYYAFIQVADVDGYAETRVAFRVAEVASR